jgi:hypothetical protein
VFILLVSSAGRHLKRQLGVVGLLGGLKGTTG